MEPGFALPVSARHRANIQSGIVRVDDFLPGDIDKLQLSGKSAYDYLDEVILCLMRTIIQTPNAVGGKHRFQVLGPSDTDPGRGEFARGLSRSRLAGRLGPADPGARE